MYGSSRLSCLIRHDSNFVAKRHFRSVSDFLEQHCGDEHVYLLYKQRLRAQVNLFIASFPGTTLYAVKANPDENLLRLLYQMGISHFDVASLNEISLIQRLLPDAKMYLMNPVKSRVLLERAASIGIRDYSLDCEGELEKIDSIGLKPQDVTLYVRIEVPGSQHAILPLNQKFGAPFKLAVRLAKRVRSRGYGLGYCFHVGSQCMSPTAYRDAIKQVYSIAEASGCEPDVIDVGGGFPVAYPGMDPADLQSYFQMIRIGLAQYKLRGVKILGEPGRSLVAEAGSTLVRIDLRKNEHLYINDGAYGSLFDAGRFSWKYPVRLYRNCLPVDEEHSKGFQFYGPTCDSSDHMPGPFFLPRSANEGDWIEVQNLGAYGSSIASRFNGFYSNTKAIVDASTASYKL